MKVLVTGGAGFIGSHVVDKLLEAGHEPLIFDLRASPYHSPRRSSRSIGDVTDREALLAGGPRLRRYHPPCCGRRRGRCRGAARPRRSASTRREPSRSSRPLAKSGYSECSTAARPGSTATVGPTGSTRTRRWRRRATSTRRPSWPASSTARRYRELFGVEYTILRFGIPYGPRAREATVIAAFVGQGRGRRAADHGGRRQASPGASSTSRTSPREWSPPCAPRRRTAPTTWRGTRQVTILEIAEAVRAQVRGHRDSSVPRLEAPTSAVSTSPASAPPRSSAGPRALRSRRASAATWSGGASGPARAGPWSSPPTSARVMTSRRARSRPGCAPNRQGSRSRSRTVCGPWDASITLVVRDGSWLSFNWLPWLFEAQYFLLARFPPTRWLRFDWLPAGGSGLRKAIRDRRSRLDRLHVSGHDRRPRRAPATRAPRGPGGLRDHRPRRARFWAHPGVDLHTVTYRESIEEVERSRAPAPRAGLSRRRPPSSCAPRRTPRRAQRLGLPDDGKVVVVSGGGWGIGDLAGAVRRRSRSTGPRWSASPAAASGLVAGSSADSGRIRASGCSGSPTR